MRAAVATEKTDCLRGKSWKSCTPDSESRAREAASRESPFASATRMLDSDEVSTDRSRLLTNSRRPSSTNMGEYTSEGSHPDASPGRSASKERPKRPSVLRTQVC